VSIHSANIVAFTFSKKNVSVLLRSEIPSGMCAKLRTVAASNNRDHASQSLFAYASRYAQSFTC